MTLAEALKILREANANKMAEGGNTQSSSVPFVGGWADMFGKDQNNAGAQIGDFLDPAGFAKAGEGNQFKAYAPSVGYQGTGYNYGADVAAANEAQARGNVGQQQQVTRLSNLAKGVGPSESQMQLQAATQSNLQNQAAMAASQRGGNPGMAQRQMGQNQANINQQASGQSAMTRLQEQHMAEQALGQALSTQRGQNLGQYGQAMSGWGSEAGRGLQAGIAGGQLNLGAQKIQSQVAASNAAAGNQQQGGGMGGMGSMMQMFGKAKGGAVKMESGGDVDPWVSDFGSRQSESGTGAGIDPYSSGAGAGVNPSSGGTGYGLGRPEDSTQEGMPAASTGPASPLKGTGAEGTPWGMVAGLIVSGIQTARLQQARNEGKFSSLNSVTERHAEGGDLGDGGRVPGKIPPGPDSERNDIVPTILTSGEVVIPKTIAQDEDAPQLAAAFIKAIKAHKSPKAAARIAKKMDKGGQTAETKAMLESKHDANPDWAALHPVGDLSNLSKEELHDMMKKQYAAKLRALEMEKRLHADEVKPAVKEAPDAGMPPDSGPEFIIDPQDLTGPFKSSVDPRAKQYLRELDSADAGSAPEPESPYAKSKAVLPIEAIRRVIEDAKHAEGGAIDDSLAEIQKEEEYKAWKLAHPDGKVSDEVRSSVRKSLEPDAGMPPPEVTGLGLSDILGMLTGEGLERVAEENLDSKSRASRLDPKQAVLWNNMLKRKALEGKARGGKVSPQALKGALNKLSCK